MSTMLSCEGLTFSYGEREVLAGVDVAIEEGEFFGILGPNGSGKSTLLKIVAGLLQQSAGQVKLRERDAASIKRRDFAREVAFLPQDLLVEFPYKVSEVVLLGRMPHLGFLGFPGARDLEIAEAALVATDCLELRERRIHELSGGERQRVFFAKALAQEPKLLLLDEVTAHLDLHHQVALHDLLWARNRAGELTVVTVLHDLNLAAQYCDRLLLLDEGRVVACGTVEEVLTYANVKKVFDVEPYVGVNEINKTRFLVPMRAPGR